MIRALGLAALLALAACTKPAPQPTPRYTLGEPYSLGGLWSYPKEAFAGSETGFAAIIPDSAPGRTTANGEIFDPGRLVGAHRTLQLPAIIRVHNLDTGLEILLRINDRGPAKPGRLIGVSARAAELLRMPPAGAPVRVTIEEAPSRALAQALPSPDRPAPPIAAAPRAAVETEQLAPLPGARDAPRLRIAPASPAAVAIAEPTHALPPDPLPEEVRATYAMPGRPVIEAGLFFRRDLAERQAARLGARVLPIGSGRQAQYRVRLGPFPDLAAADAAIAAALRAGLPELQLRVE